MSDIEKEIQQRLREIRGNIPRNKLPGYRIWLRIRRQHFEKVMVVSNQWLDNFERFSLDVGIPPKSKVLLRKNAAEPLGPSNYVWASRAELMIKNRRYQKYMLFNEWLSVPEISKKYGISEQLIRYRIRKRKSPMEIIKRPRYGKNSVIRVGANDVPG